MASILARRPYSDLGWRWMRIGGSGVAHLVPARVLERSRTACSRLPVYDATLETPEGLLGEIPLCADCRGKDS